MILYPIFIALREPKATEARSKPKICERAGNKVDDLSQANPQTCDLLRTLKAAEARSKSSDLRPAEGPEGDQSYSIFPKPAQCRKPPLSIFYRYSIVF